MSLDDAQKFLIEFAEMEYQASRAVLLEPDVAKFMAMVWKHDAQYGEGMASGISRPEGDPTEYSSAENISAAAQLHPRSLFAVARYEQKGGEIYRGWMGSDEDGKFGEGMRASYYIMPVDGALKVVTRFVACSGCRGTGIREGMSCPSCDYHGWVFRGGKAFRKPRPIIELRKLKPPSNHRYLPGYECIQLSKRM